MKFYLSLILAFISIPIFGQRVHFSLDVNGQCFNSASYQSEREYLNSEYRFISADSLWEKTITYGSNILIQKYSPKVGVDVNWNAHIGIGNKFFLKSGIGFNYILFETNSEFPNDLSYNLSKEEIIDIDTIKASRYNTFPSNVYSSPTYNRDPCDGFKESSINSSELKVGVSNHILSLKIPIEVEYELLQDKFFVGVGGYFQTPIYTEVKRETLYINRELGNGETVCEAVKVVLRNKSGDGFNNSQIGVMGNLTYRFFRNFGLKFSVSKDLNNLYGKPRSTTGFLSIPINDYRPMRFSFGLNYKFGGKFKRGSNNSKLIIYN